MSILKTIYVVNVPTKEAINILKHMNTKNEIIKLLKKCEEHYELFKNKEIVLDQIKKKYVVKQSIPILFFGDIEEYFSSKIKKMNLIGSPYQIIIGKQTDGDLIEFKELGNDTKKIKLKEIIEIIKKQKETN